VRTTINISEELYRAAKARAAISSQTVSEVIEDAVREALRPKPVVDGAHDPLPVFGGQGLLPGVDLSTSEALLDAMDVGEGTDALR
jgi:hypothetical protein